MIREHLETVRVHALALVKTLEAALADLDTPPDGECRHPLSKRIGAATMTQPDLWVCPCGAVGGEAGEEES